MVVGVEAGAPLSIRNGGRLTVCGEVAAAYGGVFHAVSAFKNAGFALYATSLTPFAPTRGRGPDHGDSARHRIDADTDPATPTVRFALLPDFGIWSRGAPGSLVGTPPSRSIVAECRLPRFTPQR
ncbi:potassium transporter TrkG [Saccharothrix sp. NRRL B-16348]|uniref:potassium transporter TrkG n=1 Tax=Saccharothrix sp. NRRL B-16348 TaxID=1415542 RepID=UPI0018D01791|nr:potassium transporter TrkG [Saccharothrix sp. NRRL B-16348]